jgi:hypothetical protein
MLSYRGDISIMTVSSSGLSGPNVGSFLLPGMLWPVYVVPNRRTLDF